MTRLHAVLLPLLLVAGTALAQPVSEEELAFWQAVEQSGRPAEYQAYLDTFPNGRFAALARLRAAAAAPGRPTAPAAPPPPAPTAKILLRPAAGRVALVQGVVVDVDATALRAGSNHRLAVMPANAPDAIEDPTRFASESTPLPMGRLHLTLPSGPPGQDEIRLYYIPRYESAFVVGARAAVSITPGVAGATLARDLVREAERLGPVRFEVIHRDRPMLVQAAFLRLRPSTEWNVAWFPGGLVSEVARQTVVISIGMPGVVADEFGSNGEIVCALPATGAALDRIAAFQVGDPVVVRGTPTIWNGRSGAEPVLLDRCSLQN